MAYEAAAVLVLVAGEGETDGYGYLAVVDGHAIRGTHETGGVRLRITIPSGRLPNGACRLEILDNGAFYYV